MSEHYTTRLPCTGTFIFKSVNAQLKVNRISIVVHGRGLVNLAVEQLYQVDQDLMNMSDDTICCLSCLYGTACTCALWQYERKKEKRCSWQKQWLRPVARQTLLRPHAGVYVCVWSSVATVIKSGSFCALRDISYLVSERNVPPLHHST